MDAEEKKLSHSSETGLYQDSRTGFRLHYFPDIPVDEPDNEHICAPLEDKFQRVRYDGAASNCSDIASGFIKSESRPDRNSSSDDRFDVQAYQKGVTDGLEKGTKEGEKHGFEMAARKLEPLLGGLQQGLLQLSTLRQDTYHRIEKEVVELALAIARRIICREIEVDKEVVVCVAREALSQVKDPGNIKIKLNPSDLEFINQTKYQLSEMTGDINNVSLEAEDGIQSGGCVIETNLGEIDARIEKQLQAVEESFRTALEKSTAEI